ASGGPRSGAAPAEERLYQRAAVVLAHAADHVESMVVSRELTAADRRADRARLRLRGTKDERPNARMDERAHTHQARLDGDAQERAGETVVADRLRGRADGDDLGVSGWITRRDRLIEPPADNRAVDRHHGADRDFTRIARAARFIERRGHQLVVDHLTA